jgi:hypothetical protein
MQLFRFQGDRRHSFIYNLLVRWNRVLCDLEAAMAPWDLPYVYGERPNLGILAAAATRIKYVPFEEYSAEKGRGKSRRLGRADLWLATKSGAKAFDFEAKYISPSFRSKKLAKTIQHHLDIAAKDASDIRYKSDCTIGIIFVSPYGATHENFDPDPFWDQLSDLKQYGGDLCAFHICKPEIWGETGYKDRPGIAIVGRYI